MVTINRETEVTYKLNNEKKGVEIYFSGKPSEAVRTELKANGFKWSSFAKCWYSRQNENTIAFAEKLVNGTVTPEAVEQIEVVTTKAKRTKKTEAKLSLWQSTQFTELEGINKEQECKELAKEIRSHIRKRFPQCKISVTVPYYGKIDVSIKSSPFEKGSVYLEAVKKYCDELLNAYRHTYDAADYYSDYASNYNFSGWVSVYYAYEQTEVTNTVIEEMKDFDEKYAEFIKQEQERKDAEYDAWLKEEAERAEESIKREEIRKQQEQQIYNNVTEKVSSDNERYYIAGVNFAHLNKNDTLTTYIEEVAKGGYSKETVKVSKEIHFTDKQALELFSNSLLNDYDFIEGTGGSYADDARINSMMDYNHMSDEERATVQWNRYGAAIYYDNELQFVVDAQGYSYARYVGLTDNATIEKEIVINTVLAPEEVANLKQQAEQLEDISFEVLEEINGFTTWKDEKWCEYKVTMKEAFKRKGFKFTKAIIQQIEAEEFKSYMYKLLTECNSLQSQFEDAKFVQGEKLTMYQINGIGMMSESRITFSSKTNTKYAQYSDAVKIEFKPENKRNMYEMNLHGKVLIFRGWQQLPEMVLNEVSHSNGFKVTRGKFSSCDERQYDAILAYFKDQDLEAAVNTYKPIF